MKKNDLLFISLLLIFLVALSSAIVYAVSDHDNQDRDDDNSGRNGNYDSEYDEDSNGYDDNSDKDEIRSRFAYRESKRVKIFGEDGNMREIEIKYREREDGKIEKRIKFKEKEAGSELEIEEFERNGGTELRAKLSNGKNSEIKIMPDRASEIALARLRLKVCTEQNNCEIILKEVGKQKDRGDNGEMDKTAAYEIKAEKRSRVLGLFRAKMEVRAKVDATTGEILDIKKPWWAFLSKELEGLEANEDDEDDHIHGVDDVHDEGLVRNDVREDGRNTVAPESHTIEMSSAGFSPSSLTISEGDIVVFVSVDDSNRWPASDIHPTHTVYTESTGTCPRIGGSDFDSCGGIANGDSWPFTFNKVGNWEYHDHLSPRKTGTIKVVGV